MFQRRTVEFPAAMDLGYWQNHFATRAACESKGLKGHVLDAGCGTGEVAVWLHRARPELTITSVDLSQVALGHAATIRQDVGSLTRAKLPLAAADLSELPFRNAAFDSAFLSHTLEHLANPGPVLAELSRVLRPDAFTLVIVPEGWNHDDPDHQWHLDLNGWISMLNCYGVVEDATLSPDNDQVSALVRLKSPKIVGMLRVRNEERHLHGSLDSLRGVTDAVVVLDDGSTDATPEICKHHPLVATYVRQDGLVTDEVRDKNFLLQAAMDLSPQWIIAVDGDEALEPGGAQVVRELAHTASPLVDTIEFDFPYFWNDSSTVRIDGEYSSATRHPRMFRVRPGQEEELRFLPTGHGSNFHGGSVPDQLAGATALSPARLLHFGYLDPQLREHKQAFYSALDPVAAAAGYYDHLVSAEGLRVIPYQQRDFSDWRAPAEFSVEREEQSLVDAVPLSARVVACVGRIGEIPRLLNARSRCAVVAVVTSDSPTTRSPWIDCEVALEQANEVLGRTQFDALLFRDALNPTEAWDRIDRLITNLKPKGRVVLAASDLDAARTSATRSQRRLLRQWLRARRNDSRRDFLARVRRRVALPRRWELFG